MKNKNSKFKIGTILTAISCLVGAVLFWLFAKYLEGGTAALKLMLDSAFSLI